MLWSRQPPVSSNGCHGTPARHQASGGIKVKSRAQQCCPGFFLLAIVPDNKIRIVREPPLRIAVRCAVWFPNMS
jgi:hypothetical protein